MKNQVLNKTFCIVTASKVVNYFEEFSYSDIMARIGDEYPKHVEAYMEAEIKSKTESIIGDIETESIVIKTVINRVLKLHDISLSDLLDSEEIQLVDDADQLSLGDIANDGDFSIDKV